MVLSCRDLSYQVWFVIETRKDNDLIDQTSVIYDEIETKLS